MSQQELLYRSIKAIHVFGFLLWIGSMFALTLAMSAHERASGPARDALIDIQRSMGRAMELGALLAIACGVVMILRSPATVPPLKQPYLHIKLTLAVLLIVMHGLVRARMARLRRGEGSAPPAWLGGLVLLIGAAMIWLAVVKPMLRV